MRALVLTGLLELSEGTHEARTMANTDETL